MKTSKCVVVALILAASVVASACAQSSGPAPNFSLKTASGATVELKKMAGKVVVVNFWATWCGPCRAEIPGMMQVYEKYRKQGLEIVGISLDEGGWDDVNPFLEKVKINYPVVIGNATVAQAYGGIEAIPTTFFVDKKGNVVDKHVGYMSAADFEKAIKAML